MAIKTVYSEELKLSDNVRSNCSVMRSDIAVGTYLTLSVRYNDHTYWAHVGIEDRMKSRDGCFTSNHCSLFEDGKSVNLIKGVGRINKAQTNEAIELAKGWFASIRNGLVADRFEPFAQ